MKSYQVFKLVSLFVFWLFLNSCAPSSTLIQTPPPDIPSRVAKASLIQNISFMEEENYTRIQIEGSEILDPPFYKLLSDPLRIVIDISNIDLKQIKEPVKVDNGTVTKILATQFDDKGRVEIGLAQMANYNIFKEDKNLIIDVEKVKKMVGVQEEASDEKKTELMPSEVKREEILSGQPVEIASPKETLKKANEILNFIFDQGKDFLTLNIVADGKIGKYDAFKLDAPTRLVLDIWEVDTRYPTNSITTKNPFVKKIRIGHHPDKLRLVFEPLHLRLPSYQINQIEKKLVVSFGNVPKIPEPQVILPEKTLEKTPPPKVQVKGPISFKQMDNKSRIIVSLTEEPQFEVNTISKKIIAVNIKNASLPKHLQRGLDTSAFDSAVQYIDMKNVQVGKMNEVQILIQLREEVPFETLMEGKDLLIDVEKPKKIEGKIEGIPETKKEEVTMEAKKEEVTVEAKKEEAKKEEEKPLPKTEKMESVSPKAEEKPIPQPEVTRKVGVEKKVTEEWSLEKTYSGRKVSLDFKDADIKNILRLIAEVSNFNIIAGDDVKGKITMRLVDVPWDQALDVVLQSQGLGMSKVGNVIRIAPIDSIKKEVQMELEAKRAKEKLEDLGTELISINYATAKEIFPQIKGILSDRGDVKLDERTNVLIVKDIARNISAARELVKLLDKKTPQVMIEARIVEANLTFQRELGISWGFMAHQGPNKGNREVSVGGGTPSTSTLRAPIGTPSVNTRSLVDLPAAGGSILEFLFTSDYGLKSLDVAISAFEEQGDVKVISSPKIATLDNKEASVEQGLRIPYLKLTTEGTVTTDFIDANLKLTVTPHVTNDGHIKLSIKVKKDAPDDSIKVQEVPSIDKKEAITEVMIRDGGVVSIAGIYTIEKNLTTDGVPLLKKIPVFGWLFKNESKSDNRRDLLIFISPKIIKDQV